MFVRPRQVAWTMWRFLKIAKWMSAGRLVRVRGWLSVVIEEEVTCCAEIISGEGVRSERKVISPTADVAWPTSLLVRAECS